jgi:cation diffusion facilitator CzcD-associated flavoprotein CzcO
MPDSTATPSPRRPGQPLDALIIGAGFSGMYMLHSLRDRLGLNALVVERGGDVGGTWYWNRYPGARCDSESHSYCFAFSEELWRGWDWSQRYPDHAEIRRYMNYVAERLDLRRDIRFGTNVTACAYDEAANLWRVTVEGGEVLAARYLITGVGCLSTANVPKIPGLEDFAGQWYHTGEWPHEGVDLAGKRVGQIGTGSTGIQAAPAIAAEAAHLTVFQRTANYSSPANNQRSAVSCTPPPTAIPSPSRTARSMMSRIASSRRSSTRPGTSAGCSSAPASATCCSTRPPTPSSPPI